MENFQLKRRRHDATVATQSHNERRLELWMEHVRENMGLVLLRSRFRAKSTAVPGNWQ